MEASVFPSGFLQQVFPIVGWMATLDHAAENAIGVRAAAIGTFCFLIVYPGVDDDFAFSVITEK